MPDNRIEEIKQALEAATPGPWYADTEEWPGNSNLRYWVQTHYDRVGAFVRHEDAILFANAPEWLRHLLQLAEQQQAEIERLKDDNLASSELVWEWMQHASKVDLELFNLSGEHKMSREENERLRGLYEREREIAERLRGELEREASDAAYWKSEYERAKSAVFKWGKECDRAKVHNERLLLDIKLTKAELRSVENLGLKYQGELKKYRTPRPLEDWHEDYGDVLWWTLPIEEPPYCGSPLGSDWPGYHTHWTPLIEPIYEKGESQNEQGD